MTGAGIGNIGRGRAGGGTAALAWMTSAACAQVDPELFFPGQGEPASAAKRICASCTVRDACLDYADAAGHVDGIWGGMTVTERRHARRAAA